MYQPVIVMQGLGSFAEVVNPTPPPNVDQISAEMDKVVSAARRAIVMMKAKAAIVPVATAMKPTLVDALLGPVGAAIELMRGYTAYQNETTSIDGALDTMSQLVDKYDGPDRAAVLAGRLSPDKWIAGMLAVQQGIYSMGQGLDYDDPGTILWNQIQASKKAIGQLLQKAGDVALHTLNWLKWALPATLGIGIGVALLLNPATHAAVSVARKGLDVGTRATKAVVSAAKNKTTPAKPLAGLTRRQLRLRRRHQRRRV